MVAVIWTEEDFFLCVCVCVCVSYVSHSTDRIKHCLHDKDL
jgi:hypothetical protein